MTFLSLETSKRNPHRTFTWTLREELKIALFLLRLWESNCSLIYTITLTWKLAVCKKIYKSRESIFPDYLGPGYIITGWTTSWLCKKPLVAATCWESFKFKVTDFLCLGVTLFQNQSSPIRLHNKVDIDFFLFLPTPTDFLSLEVTLFENKFANKVT